MPVNLKGRSFLTLKDFTPDEIRYMLNLAADLKAKKRAGIRGNLLAGKNIVLLFEKTSTRTRCAFEVAAYDEGANVTFLDSRVLPDGQEGNDGRHRQGPGPLLRRHRVPRLRPEGRRGSRRQRGRARVERPDRRRPPDAGACRHPDADGEHQKAAQQVQARLLRRHAQQRRLLPHVHLRQARHPLCRLGPEGAGARR